MIQHKTNYVGFLDDSDKYSDYLFYELCDKLYRI